MKGQCDRVNPGGSPSAIGVAARPELEGISEAARPHARFNYFAMSFEGGFFVAGMAFVSMESVLPAMVRSLGGPDLLISFLPMFMMIGFTLPPLLTAHRVERLRRMKPFCLVTGVFQRLPYLVAGLMLWFYGESHPFLCMVFVAAAPLISGLCGGVSMSAWFSLVARTIPTRRRASSGALRNIIGTAIGFGAGYVVEYTLESHPGTQGYAYLHLYAFGFLALSYFVFSRIREVDAEPQEGGASPASLLDNLRSIPAMLRADQRYRRFLLARTSSLGMYLVVPFLALEACKQLGRDESYVGALVSAQMLGGILGNLLTGYLGDKYGAKGTLLISRLFFLLVALLFLFPQGSWSYQLAFFLLGANFFMHMLGGQVLLMDISPSKRMPTYAAFMALCGCLMMITVGLTSGLLKAVLAEAFNVQLGAAMVLTLVSTYYLLRIREPRTELN